MAQILVQNRVPAPCRRCRKACRRRACRRSKIDRFPADGHADLAGRPLRQAVPDELRHDQPARRGRASRGVGHVTVFGAGKYAMRIWLDPDKLRRSGSCPQDVIQAVQQQSRSPAPARSACRRRRRGRVSSIRSTSRPARRRPEFENIVVKTDSGRPHHAAEGRRARRARRPDLRPDLQARRQAAAGIAIYQLPTPTRWTWRSASRQDGGAGAARFPQGMTYDIPFDTTKFVDAADPRGLQDADRGRRPRADRHPRVPAGLAGHAGAGDDRAGDDHRRLRRHGGARLHRQPVDALRPGAGDRHRRRRRDRDRRGRGQPHRAGHVGRTRRRSRRWTS